MPESGKPVTIDNIFYNCLPTRGIIETRMNRGNNTTLQIPGTNNLLPQAITSLEFPPPLHRYSDKCVHMRGYSNTCTRSYLPSDHSTKWNSLKPTVWVTLKNDRCCLFRCRRPSLTKLISRSQPSKTRPLRSSRASSGWAWEVDMVTWPIHWERLVFL